MKLARRDVVFAFLAGSAVAIIGSTIILQLTGVQAQDRMTVKMICANHRALRYATSTTADGTATRDLLQEAADDCRMAKRAFRVAREQHVATGSPTIAELKALRDAATTAGRSPST
jgi:uncharacterized membrane protein YccC